MVMYPYFARAFTVIMALYELLRREDGYVEYLIPVGDTLLRVGQRCPGELLFFDIDEQTLDRVAVPFFSMNTDFEAIRPGSVGAGHGSDEAGA